MDKEKIKKALDELKTQPKRKFSQTYDLIVNLKNFEIKKHPIDFFVNLPYSSGKKIKVAAFVGPQMEDEAEKTVDLVIKEADFSKYADKKMAKKLAVDYDYFIAQANLMPKIAQTFGKVLGIRGKMPNPKLGCVVPPNTNLAPLVEKLSKAVRLVAKKGMNLQSMVGKEDQTDDEVIENILAVYNSIIKNVPNEMQNVKNVLLKLTMGKPVKV
jgi:large subunit ribosomal protein L1